MKRTAIILLAILWCLPNAPTRASETAGNNLSFPVVWADGVTKKLRGDPEVPRFDGEYVTIGLENWYLQQDPDNEWQAQSLRVDPLALGPVAVSSIDWGDNLESKDWYENSVVRVETVLYFEGLTPEMTGYEVLYLYGEGKDEMWGTNTLTYLSDTAAVYCACARLTIQKLTKDRTDPTLTLKWDTANGLWVGDAEEPYFNSGVWESEEGPETPNFYSAEINIAGKLIYGYNWRAIRSGGEGDYRITFSLDNINCEQTLNTVFDENTRILMSEEGEEGIVTASEEGDSGEQTGGGFAVVDVENNLTYIDVRILAREKGGGKGNQGMGGKGSQGENAGKGKPTL